MLGRGAVLNDRSQEGIGHLSSTHDARAFRARDIAYCIDGMRHRLVVG